jgi:hypothetical protein
MEAKHKPSAQALTGLLRLVDARASLPRIGLAAGALGGAGYTVESAPHMILPASTDLYLVGLMLTVLGGAAGWLAGAMLGAPLVRSGDRSAAEAMTVAAQAPTEERTGCRAARDTGAPGRERG